MKVYMPSLPHDTKEQVPTNDPRAHIVSINPERLSGAPCFAGSRVPIQNLWDYLESGESLDDFLSDFPGVTRDQVLALLHLANERMLDGLRRQ